MSESAVERVLLAAADWWRCSQALQRCVREAHYEAGYFCHSYRESESNARAEFGAALSALIDERIQVVRAGEQEPGA